MTLHPAIEKINGSDDAAAVQLILPFVERSPDVAAAIASLRPFTGPDDLAKRVAEAVLGLDDASAVGMFNRHPELAPTDPLVMTAASQSEQSRLGLDTDAAAKAELANLNRIYSGRFGFPFILALHEHTGIGSVLSAFRRRLDRSRAEEIAENRRQICSVSRARIAAAFRADQELTR